MRCPSLGVLKSVLLSFVRKLGISRTRKSYVICGVALELDERVVVGRGREGNKPGSQVEGKVDVVVTDTVIWECYWRN